MSDAKTALKAVASRVYQQHILMSTGKSRHQAILDCVLEIEPYQFPGQDAHVKALFDVWRDRLILLIMDVNRLNTVGQTPELIEANRRSDANAQIIQKRQAAMMRIGSAKTTLGKKLIYHLNKKVLSVSTDTIQKAANFTEGLRGAAMSGYNAKVSADLEALESYHPMNLAFWAFQDCLLPDEKPESNDKIQEIVNFLVDCLKND